MHLARYTVHQRTVGTESRTIGHTGGDLLTYRVDGLLPRSQPSLGLSVLSRVLKN